MNGVALSRLARLNPDGSLDAGFNPGAGPSDLVLTLAIQADGMLVLGGLFTTYDGTNVGMIARVYGDPALPLVAAERLDSTHVLMSWPSWAKNYALQTTEGLGPASWETLTNRAESQGDRLTLTLPSSTPSRFYRLIGL